MNTKPKIAFVSNADKNCGVYEYGKLTFLNLQKSKNYEYHFIEAHDVEQFLEQYNNQQYDGSIWNCGAFPWMYLFLKNLPDDFKPTFVITGHGSCYDFLNVKKHFVCDPLFTETNSHIPVGRPLIKISGLNSDSPKEIIKVGSFGFGGWCKNFTGIVQAVNQQFSEAVEINLNISYGDYYEYHRDLNTSHIIADTCRQIANPNVIVNISHEYLETEQIIKFLNSNDINVFLYENNDYAGISSCVDFALMAMKPLIINKSNQFKTINWKTELLIENNSIKEVLQRGLEPTNEFREKWSNANIIKTFENQLDNYFL